MGDVVFYVADKHMKEGLQAFFRRNNWHHALRCARFAIDPESPRDIFQAAGQNDPGVWKMAGPRLQQHAATHGKAILVIDADFDPYPDPVEIRADVSASMRAHGWTPDRFETIVIEPMVEAWLWADGPSTAQGLGVRDFNALKTRLTADGLWHAGEAKPHRLKEARNAAARMGGRKTGAPIFRAVFTALSSRALDNCVEPGFVLLRQTLQRWFPPQAVGA
jgi:hypothetical protein